MTLTYGGGFVTRQRAICWTMVLVLPLAGRTATFDRAQASTATFQPTFEDPPCPPGVPPADGNAISCGYLTVLEDRADPSGPATEARLDHPAGIAVDPKGRITFADSGNNRVRRIGLKGMITTVAGNGNDGCSAGRGARATEGALRAGRVQFDPQGNLYVWGGHCGRIWMVDKDGVVTTIAGTGVLGFSGDGGPATRARLSCCGGGMAFGPDGVLYIADAKNNRVRKVVFP